jgi:hypothetical protein
VPSRDDGAGQRAAPRQTWRRFTAVRARPQAGAAQEQTTDASETSTGASAVRWRGRDEKRLDAVGQQLNQSKSVLSVSASFARSLRDVDIWF